MIAAIDYYGIAAVIAAVTGLLAAVFGFLQRKPVSETHAAVQLSNGKSLGEVVETVAQGVEDAATAAQVVKETLANVTPETPAAVAIIPAPETPPEASKSA